MTAGGHRAFSRGDLGRARPVADGLSQQAWCAHNKVGTVTPQADNPWWQSKEPGLVAVALSRETRQTRGVECIGTHPAVYAARGYGPARLADAETTSCSSSTRMG